MFGLFNVAVLDDAVRTGQEIRFSHEPREPRGTALWDEWRYLDNRYGYGLLEQGGDGWVPSQSGGSNHGA